MSPNATGKNSTTTSSGLPSSMRLRWCAARRCPCRAGSRRQGCRSDFRWWHRRAARRSFWPARKCWRIFWACAARRRSIRDRRSNVIPHGEEASSRQRTCAVRCAVSNHEARGPSFETRPEDRHSSCPGLTRASTSCFLWLDQKTWMAGTSPAMTKKTISFRRPVRPSFVLQLEKHCEHQAVDHFRLVERNKFRLVQHRVDQRAEHHLKREANAPLLGRDPAAAHPRQQQRLGEIDHRTSGGADRSPSLRIDALILRGGADDTDIAAHDIDGDFDDPSTGLLQSRTGIVLVGHRGADGGQRLCCGKRHQRTEEGVPVFEAAVEGAYG